MIELVHLKKEYENVSPFTDLNAVINNGDVISIIGPSGTGKTTLLRCINMMDPPTSGQVIVDGEDVTVKGYDYSKLRKKVGMVFQSFNLFEHYTVIENIMEPQIKLLGKTRQEAYDRGVELLKVVNLSDKQLNYPSELSGGQKQRIAIARTLAMDPEVILFDEPTSALDPTMVGEVEDVIKGLRKTGVTMLVVTHEMRFAKEIANRVFFLAEGGLYEDGTPEQIFDHPRKPLTKEFFYKRRTCELKIENKEADLYSMASKFREFINSYDSTMRQKKFFSILNDELLYPVLDRIEDKNYPIDLKLICSDTSRDHKMSISFIDLEENPMEMFLDDISKKIFMAYVTELTCENKKCKCVREQGGTMVPAQRFFSASKGSGGCLAGARLKF